MSAQNKRYRFILITVYCGMKQSNVFYIIFLLCTPIRLSFIIIYLMLGIERWFQNLWHVVLTGRILKQCSGRLPQHNLSSSVGISLQWEQTHQAGVGCGPGSGPPGPGTPAPAASSHKSSTRLGNLAAIFCSISLICSSDRVSINV